MGNALENFTVSYSPKPLILNSCMLPTDYIKIDGIENQEFKKVWLVEGVIEEGRAYQWFGPWKQGKTLAVMDVCAHLSLGMEWANRRSTPSYVIWVASESYEDVMRRMAAWKLYHNKTGHFPFVIRTKPLHLDKLAFAKTLLEEVNTIKKARPDLPVLLVIDTVARSMSGEKSENDEGLRAFADNMLDIIVRPAKVAAIFVHHSGHGDKGRSRGWSGFPGALDGSIQVSMDKDKGLSRVNVVMTEMRSGKGSDSFQFAIEVQKIVGQDNFGNTIEEPVLRFLGDVPARKQKPGGKNQKNLLETLQKMTKEKKEGKVLIVDVRNSCINGSPRLMSSDGFLDAKQGLIERMLISESCGFIEIIQ